MTINVAFKIPDAVVFVTDGLGTLIDVDPVTREERIVSSIASVEKLVLLNHHRYMAMCNGVGSLGGGSIVSELRAFDEAHKHRAPYKSVEQYVRDLNKHLRNAAIAQLGHIPAPFHLIIAGFDGHPEEKAPAELHSIQWSTTRSPEVAATEEDGKNDICQILHRHSADGTIEHSFGYYHAGAVVGPARFADGIDPSLPALLIKRLAGQELSDTDSGKLSSVPQIRTPGILEELIHEVYFAAKGVDASPLSNQTVHELARKYAGRIASDVLKPDEVRLSQHFSLQAAVNYSIFLAYCAYVRENWSPSVHGPPRVGSTMQVAYLTRSGEATFLSGVKLGVGLKESLHMGWHR